MDVTRRTALMAAAGAAAAPAGALTPVGAGPLGGAAGDDAAWARVGALYPVAREIIQLECGYWGSMAAPVAAVHHANVDRLNRENSWYARRAMYADQRIARDRMAAAMGVLPEEVGMARNAAEALSALIGQFRDVGPGDRILYADIDYESCQSSMVSLARARGAEAVKINAPREPTYEGLIETYKRAIDATPRLKLVLLTHMTHRAGLLLPVKEIAAHARSRGVQVIADVAQSFYQVPFKLPDLGVDFIGLNLHKWVGAPLGMAGFYIRKGMTDAIAPAREEPDAKPDDTQARLHLGTFDYAPMLTVPAAFDFQARIDPAQKLARLQALRDRWVKPLRGLEGLEILVPDDARLHASSTSFRIRGQNSAAQNIAITDMLLGRFNIMSVYRSGLADGACVRITPSLFTTPAEVDALVPALRTLVAELAR